MPSWKIHAQVANKLNSKLNYYEDKDKFKSIIKSGLEEIVQK